MKDLFIFLGWSGGIVVALIILVFGGAMVCKVIDKCKTMKSTSDTSMKYKQIKDLYFVNEMRWKVARDYEEWIGIISYDSGSSLFRISVSFIDYVRLSMFFHKVEKNKEKFKKAKKLEQILSIAQKDIDARYAEANGYINDAKIIMNRKHN